MLLYGVSVLSICIFAGVFTGDIPGQFTGLRAHAGGIGAATLLLLNLFTLHGQVMKLGVPAETSANLCNVKNFPILVAMAAKQNVIAALSNGGMAIIAGVAAVSYAILRPTGHLVGQVAGLPFGWAKLVPRGGIEPPTRGFSVHCSTD